MKAKIDKDGTLSIFIDALGKYISQRCWKQEKLCNANCPNFSIMSTSINTCHSNLTIDDLSDERKGE